MKCNTIYPARFINKSFPLDLESIEEVKDFFHADHPFWKECAMTSFIFRGQRDSSWQLWPRAFRSNSFERESRPLQDIKNQCLQEYHAFETFLYSIKKHGLTASEVDRMDPERLFAKVHLPLFEQNDLGAWPCTEILDLLALAQVNGSATRLLDFSYNPLVALFFAAYYSYYERNDWSSDQKMCVWGINLKAISSSDAISSRIRKVECANTNNVCARKQQALFLFDKGANYNWNQGNPPPLEDVLENLHERSERNEPVQSPLYIKIGIPVLLDKQILHWLEDRELSSHTLIPSIDATAYTLQ